MIAYKPDNTTLFFTRDGSEYSADPMSDWERYTAFVTTLNAQQEAVRQDKSLADNYRALVNNYNASILAGRVPGTPPPMKPLQVTVDDPILNADSTWAIGLTSYGPFSPALPDVATMPMYQGSGGAIKATLGLPPDPNQAILGALATISVKIDRLLAKVGA